VENAGYPALDPHDLWRTFRPGLLPLQCPNEIAEAVLGHTRGDYPF